MIIFRPDLKDILISERNSINKKIEIINKVIQPYKNKNDELFAQLQSYQEKQNKLLNDKQLLLKKKDDFKSNYISEDSLQILNYDKQRLSMMLEEKNKLNIYNQINDLLGQYKNGLISDDRFIQVLLSLKNDIENDKELKNQNSKLYNNIINKMNSIIELIKNKNVKQNQSQSEEQVLEDDIDETKSDNDIAKENEPETKEYEVVEKREAPEKLKDKIKKNFKRIVAGILAVLSISSFSFGLSNYKRKNNNTNSNPSNIIYNLDYDSNDLSNNFDDIIEAQKNIAFENYDNINTNAIPTEISINNNANIYDDSYSAVRKENPEKPYHGYDMSRNVLGVTFKMPDGSLRTLYKDSKNFNTDFNELYNQGGSIEAYLTGNENGYEGFWNVNDVSTGKKR